MPTLTKPYTYTTPAAVVNEATENALKAEQSARHLSSGKRPTMVELIGALLTEWAQKRP